MTSTAIAPYQPASLDEIQRTAKLLMASGYFDAKGSPEVQIAQLATKIIAGAELGYAPFTAVQGIHVIQGKPSIGANLMAAAVKAHPNYDYRVLRMDNDGVELEFFQLVNGAWASLGVESFTMDDAKAAGLLGKDNWKKFPRNMLFARCISNGVRFRCPDVFNGNSVYVPEELGANVDGDGNVIDAGYTVHKPQAQPVQNGNGHDEDARWADVDVTVDMAAIPEDTAGHLATPQPTNGNGHTNAYATMFADESIAFSEAATGMITKLREAARNSSKPMMAKQYGFLCSLVDGVAGDNMHGAVLSCVLGTDISSDNMPGMGAKVLIDWLKSDNEATLAKTKAAVGEIAAKCRELA